MISILTFLISGAMIAALLLGKRHEEKTHKPFFILGWISQGDTHARELSHRSAHLYAEVKERGVFFVRKQFPMHAQSSFHKLQARLDERINYYTQELRDSKLLKKSDGISEFLKNIAEVEKGNGEINDTLVDSQNTSDEIK